MYMNKSVVAVSRTHTLYHLHILEFLDLEHSTSLPCFPTEVGNRTSKTLNVGVKLKMI